MYINLLGNKSNKDKNNNIKPHNVNKCLNKVFLCLKGTNTSNEPKSVPKALITVKINGYKVFILIYMNKKNRK